MSHYSVFSLTVISKKQLRTKLYILFSGFPRNIEFMLTPLTGCKRCAIDSHFLENKGTWKLISQNVGIRF